MNCRALLLSQLFLMLLSLAPSEARAFDLSDLLDYFSSSDSNSGGARSSEDSKREVLTNSDVLEAMNPLHDRNLDSGMLDNTGNVSRSMQLDREIEIYKEQHGIEDSMFDKADRYISNMIRQASDDIKKSRTAQSIGNPLDKLSDKEKETLLKVLKKMVADE